MQIGLFSYILVELHKCLDGTRICRVWVPPSKITWLRTGTDVRMVPQVLGDQLMQNMLICRCLTWHSHNFVLVLKLILPLICESMRCIGIFVVLIMGILWVGCESWKLWNTAWWCRRQQPYQALQYSLHFFWLWPNLYKKRSTSTIPKIYGIWKLISWCI